MAKLAGINTKFVEVSVAIDNENESYASINVFLINPQQNSPHLYLHEKLAGVGSRKRKGMAMPCPADAYQLFSWDYKRCC